MKNFRKFIEHSALTLFAVLMQFFVVHPSYADLTEIVWPQKIINDECVIIVPAKQILPDGAIPVIAIPDLTIPCYGEPDRDKIDDYEDYIVSITKAVNCEQTMAGLEMVKCVLSRTFKNTNEVLLSNLKPSTIFKSNPQIPIEEISLKLTEEELLAIRDRINCLYIAPEYAKAIGVNCPSTHQADDYNKIKIDTIQGDPLEFYPLVHPLYSKSRNWENISQDDKDAAIDFIVTLANHIDPIGEEYYRSKYKMAAEIYGTNFIVEFLLNQTRIALLFNEKPYGDLINPAVATLNKEMAKSLSEKYSFADHYYDDKGQEVVLKDFGREQFRNGFKNIFSFINYSRRESASNKYQMSDTVSFQEQVKATSRGELKQHHLNYQASRLKWNSINPFSNKNAIFFNVNQEKFHISQGISTNDPLGTYSSRSFDNRGPASLAAAAKVVGTAIGIEVTKLAVKSIIKSNEKMDKDGKVGCKNRCNQGGMTDIGAGLLTIPITSIYGIAVRTGNTVYSATDIGLYEYM